MATRATDVTARVCVTSAKGGSGERTVAIHVPGAPGRPGHDVLSVDPDPQGNPSERPGLTGAHDTAPPTLFDALADPDCRGRLGDVGVSHPERDVMPSDIDVLGAERESTVTDSLDEQFADATEVMT